MASKPLVQYNIAVLGLKGSGKTSLIKAGLLNDYSPTTSTAPYHGTWCVDFDAMRKDKSTFVARLLVFECPTEYGILNNGAIADANAIIICLNGETIVQDIGMLLASTSLIHQGVQIYIVLTFNDLHPRQLPKQLLNTCSLQQSNHLHISGSVCSTDTRDHEDCVKPFQEIVQNLYGSEQLSACAKDCGLGTPYHSACPCLTGDCK